uniref:LD02611p n=1 Tax=Drosophila melanogaster TaxID=7227 RepID=Q8SZI6_DROME|nr:LD02611p [Drosophila melanogaster]
MSPYQLIQFYPHIKTITSALARRFSICMSLTIRSINIIDITK